MRCFGECGFVADSLRAFIPLDAAENNLYKNVYSVEEEYEEMNEEALACIEEYVYKAEKETKIKSANERIKMDSACSH